MAIVRVNMPTSVGMDLSDSDPRVANLVTLTSRAQTALTNNATFLAIPSPTTAQAVSQVQALTRQVDGVIRLLLGMLDTISDS